MSRPGRARGRRAPHGQREITETWTCGTRNPTCEHPRRPSPGCRAGYPGDQSSSRSSRSSRSSSVVAVGVVVENLAGRGVDVHVINSRFRCGPQPPVVRSSRSGSPASSRSSSAGRNPASIACRHPPRSRRPLPRRPGRRGRLRRAPRASVVVETRRREDGGGRPPSAPRAARLPMTRSRPVAARVVTVSLERMAIFLRVVSAGPGVAPVTGTTCRRGHQGRAARS
ncbi:hypothetical protein HBB16_16630 [Pseudonocardia sp. MCCB 268]|nr:hypothetical protein [Pseudonocardia cytotoxica]